MGLKLDWASEGEEVSGTYSSILVVLTLLG